VSRGLTFHSTDYRTIFAGPGDPTNRVKALKKVSWPLRWASIPTEYLHHVTIILTKAAVSRLSTSSHPARKRSGSILTTVEPTLGIAKKSDAIIE